MTQSLACLSPSAFPLGAPNDLHLAYAMKKYYRESLRVALPSEVSTRSGRRRRLRPRMRRCESGEDHAALGTRRLIPDRNMSPAMRLGQCSCDSHTCSRADNEPGPVQSQTVGHRTGGIDEPWSLGRAQREALSRRQAIASLGIGKTDCLEKRLHLRFV
jgi:hypothetical protein